MWLKGCQASPPTFPGCQLLPAQGKLLTLRTLTHFQPPSFSSFCPGKFPFFYFLNFLFLGPHLGHMKVPRLEVESEPQLSAYATATAMQDPSHIRDLYHSLQQCQSLNPLSKASDQTCIFMNTSQVLNPLGHKGTPSLFLMLSFPLSPHPNQSDKTSLILGDQHKKVYFVTC